MPLAIALFVRSAIQLLVTATLYKTAESFIGTALDALPKILSRAFGINEQESRDFIHDFMLDQALAFGLTILALRKQMPTVVAEKLGFTSKGFTKLGFTATAKKAIEGSVAGKIPVDLTKGVGSWSVFAKFMGVITGIFMLTQSIEVFAYRPQFFVHIAKFFGLSKPVKAILMPPTKPLFSPEEIEAFRAALAKEYSGAYSDYELMQTVLITTDWVTGLIEAGEEIVRAQLKVPTQANVLKAIREEVLARKASPTGTPTGTGKPAAAAATISPVKVFTGIVSQGALGAGVAFTARPDDIIESTDELQEAAANNLASYLASLPGKIIYELKIVASVTTKDGFRQVGQARQVISGYTSGGVPKYKTLVNKFAVLNLYILTDKGTKSKLTSVVLGPTDALKLQLTQDTLAGVERNIKQSIFTNDINDITGIKLAGISTPASRINQATGEIINPTPEEVAAYDAQYETVRMSQDPIGREATNLWEWYTAHGKAIPPMADRAVMYQDYGLGQSAYYTGTAEQNTKLLGALKQGTPQEVSQARAVSVLAGLTTATQRTGGTYYNNGKNGTKAETYGSPEQIQNREYQNKVAELTANPKKRDIPQGLVASFYDGVISLEQLAAAIQGTPDYDAALGPQVRTG